MAYDSVRAQLDKLLGPDRNGPLTAASTTPTDYHHPEICKNYLLGFCPDDLHIKHRSEPGSCRRRHSDAAKAAFEKDVASSKASREKPRWTASLLSECRAIVMDEDRKIRCHARRLKETYNAQGDLAGLMIQSFDTLKKLGMVSKDAKIRVLSEMDDEEFVTGPESDEPADRKHPSREAITLPGESNNPTSPVDRKGQRGSPKQREQDQQPTDQSNRISNHPSTDSIDTDSDDDSVKDDDADDDDDFGLIKVIPAGSNEPQESEKPENVLPRGSAQTAVQAGMSAQQSAATPQGESESKCELEEPNTETVTAVDAENGLGEGPTVITEKGSIAQPVKQEDPVLSAHNPDESEKGTDVGNREQCTAKDNATPEDITDRSQRNNEKISPPDSGEKTGNGSQPMQFVPSMDEFYERGVGPDGLLMLDRKQSLRVCACCGGYISLVDAESRLLSHYGGKSHHSLAQLRKKVVELEEQVSAESVKTNEVSRMHVREGSDERERAWSYRTDERRHSRDRYGKPPERYHDRHGSRYGGRYDDRRRGRSRRDGRGFGTAEWYNSYVHDNAGRHSSRRGDERSNFDGGQPPRYSNGRKRYRSRSPPRDFRRPRRHY